MRKLLQTLAVPVVAAGTFAVANTVEAYPTNCSTGHTSGSVWIVCSGYQYQAQGYYWNPNTGHGVWRNGPWEGNRDPSIAWGPGAPYVLHHWRFNKV